MEIDVTDFLASTDCSMLSGSVAELGTDAGRITWQNSIDTVKEFNPLPDDAALQEFRDWLRPWGGWSDDEIAAMSDEHLRALCAQWIASDWRECFEWPEHADGPDWAFYESMACEGTCPSSFYRDDTGRIFWDMTH
jgi:hypothetical protein